MEVIVVLVIAALVLAVTIFVVGSVLGRPRRTDEPGAEHDAGAGTDTGNGGGPIRDRPAGPGAEPQAPGPAGGELHPPEQQGGPAEETGLPSEAAGKQDPGHGGEGEQDESR